MNKEQFTPRAWYQRSQGNQIEIKEGIYTVCMVNDFSEPHETNKANADLIAAAPDMYEALKGMVKEMQGAEWDCPQLYQAKNALNKANPQQ